MMASSSCCSSRPPNVPRPSKEQKLDTTTSPKPKWLELPRDVTAKILHKLGAIEILTSAQRVCTLWRDICKDPLMWRAIDMRNPGASHGRTCNLEIMCRHAIDRSCGQLVDINVEYFGNDALLKYIADSASHVQRIRLVYCWEISDKGFAEVVKKLPLLEEVEISFGNLSKDSLEAIGRCCPLLKSLKFNLRTNRYIGNECDEEALAIAKTMPGLRHLQLLGNKLTDAGLFAILDGCSLLQSLDLRACFKVYLRGSLFERCAEQIKDFRLPDDSLAGIEYGDVYDDIDIDDPYADLYCDCGLTSDSDDSEAYACMVADHLGLL